MAAVDYFLKIDGISGESQNKAHKGEIDIESFSWGLQNPTTLSAGGGAGAGKAQFSEFKITKHVDQASPKLFISCAEGRHIKFATLTGFRGDARGTSQPFYKVHLEDVLVSSYQSGGSGGEGAPTDQLSLNFGKITFTEVSGGTSTEGTFNLETNEIG
jgi:type VI secretion system secreted protein Hcp